MFHLKSANLEVGVMYLVSHFAWCSFRWRADSGKPRDANQ